MTFTWVCYKSGESPNVNNVSTLNVVYPDGSNPTAPDGSQVKLIFDKFKA